MTRTNIVNQVKSIILKYARPERIYLYGSSANGEFEETSDIDIAYSDKDFRSNNDILEEVQQISTLLKIDVSNLAFCEERFVNRVISKGKILYSGTKKLRFDDGLYNFTKALERLKSACNRKDEIFNEGFSDLYLDIIVKRFEFTYEMSWKAIKRYLDFIGISVKNPRDSFKEAYIQNLFTDEAVWLNMIEQRNLSSHIYDESEISSILGIINDYLNAFEELLNNLIKKTL
jgi:nucleotidyltransferase substrate binding protein (TIGR01987 family)